MKLEKTLYTADVTVTGGRSNGTATSNDKQLDIHLGSPKELGGTGEHGTNPEQLFAAGYAACLIGAMKVVAQRMSLNLPKDTSINSKVHLGSLGEAFGISAELHINLPELEQDTAQQLVDAAHKVCPYSNATRGNIDVVLSVTV